MSESVQTRPFYYVASPIQRGSPVQLQPFGSEGARLIGFAKRDIARGETIDYNPEADTQDIEVMK
jgi:hypothetical protein